MVYNTATENSVTRKLTAAAQDLCLPLRATKEPTSTHGPKYLFRLADGKPFASFKNLKDGYRELERLNKLYHQALSS